MDFIVQYGLASLDFHLLRHEKRQYAHNSSLFILETVEPNQTKLSSTVMRWQKTGLDSICIAWERVPTFVSGRLNMLEPCRYTMNYWPEVETVVTPVPQPRLGQAYNILHGTEVC